MSKNSEKVLRWRIKKKQKLIEYKGSECEICGYNKIQFLSVFDFHHKDPSKKEFGIAAKGLTIGIDRLKKEVDKCMLLCKNCHAEIHDKETWEKREYLLSMQKVERKPKVCLFCNKQFVYKNKRQKFCSKKCGMLSLRKKEIPTKEILIKDREHLTLKEISNKYNIASSTLWYRLNN